MNIKQLLSETIPDDMTLSEREKAAIRQRIHVNKKPNSLRFLAPVVAASVLLLALILFIPTLTQDQQPAFEIERSVALPDIPYDSLIPSTYIEQTDELIYTTNDGIYRYSVEQGVSEKLYDTPKRIYDYVASEKWIVWKENTDTNSFLHIVNRETGEENSITNDSALIMSIEGDKLVHLSISTNPPSFWLLDLATLQDTSLHSQGKDGSLGMLDHENGKIVFSERTEDTSTLFVYSDVTGELLHEFPSPYASVQRLQIIGDRIYGDFASEDEHMQLGYLTMSTGEYTELDTPTYWNSIIFGDYVALDMPDKRGSDLSDVKLYKVKGQELVPISQFPEVKERLVIPYLFGRDFAFFIEEDFISDGPTLHFVKP